MLPVLQLQFTPAFGELLRGLERPSSWICKCSSTLLAELYLPIGGLILTQELYSPCSCCFLCITVQCWKISEQTYFKEGNRHLYGVWLQACKQQKYLKNPLFCYWSKGVLETLLWQQCLPSGRSMPLSVHRNKTRGGIFQNCCPPPLDHYRCADLLAWAPAARAFNEIWLAELFIGPCAENKEILLTNRVLLQKTSTAWNSCFGRVSNIFLTSLTTWVISANKRNKAALAHSKCCLCHLAAHHSNFSQAQLLTQKTTGHLIWPCPYWEWVQAKVQICWHCGNGVIWSIN